MVEVKHLSKRYGVKQAVDDISFTANDREILGFLGPNGAGKSTTMNIITGYISSTEGTVTVNGAEILENPLKVKSQIGYLPEQPPLYLDMTVRDYLAFLFDLKKIKAKKRPHIEEVCELVKIGDVAGRMIRNLSKGYRQRVGLAQALLGSPDVLILDEPTVGLDPKQIIEMRHLIRQLGEKHTVILSSHILSEVQAVSERVVIIHNGRLVADGAPDQLARAMNTDSSLTVRVLGPEDGVYRLLLALGPVRRVSKLGEQEPGAFDFTVEPEEGADVRGMISQALAGKSWPLLELRSNYLSLEDIYLRLTSSDHPAPKPDAAGEDTSGDAADEKIEADSAKGGEEQ